MFDNMRKIRQLDQKLFNAQLDNDVLRKKIDVLEEQLDIIKDKQRSATFIFDFDVYTVFSIERCWKKERDLTTIAFTHDGNLVEWNFDCNEEVHENLCFQFQEWKSKNVGDLGNV